MDVQRFQKVRVIVSSYAWLTISRIHSAPTATTKQIADITCNAAEHYLCVLRTVTNEASSSISLQKKYITNTIPCYSILKIAARIH
jgi:hypothetical protein